MTVKEFLKTVETVDNGTLKDALMDSAYIWSNDACRGYCINTMQILGVDNDTIKQVVQAMYYSFDELTITEAEETFNNF